MSLSAENEMLADRQGEKSAEKSCKQNAESSKSIDVKRLTCVDQVFQRELCRWWDSNPHVSRQSILSAPRLPFRHTGAQDLHKNTVSLGL